MRRSTGDMEKFQRKTLRRTELTLVTVVTTVDLSNLCVRDKIPGRSMHLAPFLLAGVWNFKKDIGVMLGEKGCGCLPWNSCSYWWQAMWFFFTPIGGCIFKSVKVVPSGQVEPDLTCRSQEFDELSKVCSGTRKNVGPQEMFSFCHFAATLFRDGNLFSRPPGSYVQEFCSS